MAELIVKDVALRLGDNEILKGVSLAVPAGEVVALLGPSGSGKTTLLRAVAGLETPHRGSIAIGDRVFFDAARGIDLPAEERGLGLVFQSYALWPHRTVFDNVAYGLRLHGGKGNLLSEAVEQSLKRAALWDEVKDKLHRSAFELSGGQQQRLSIARALAISPEVLLLDEPCSALDPISTARIEELLYDLKNSCTLVIVTHNMQQAARTSDYTGYFLMGNLIEFNETRIMFENPSKRETEDYITGRFG